MTCFWLMSLALLAACESPPAVDSEQTMGRFSCGDNGRLQASLIGGIATELDWTREDFECESMQRPDAKGLRLRFSGEVAGEQLAIIIAMPNLQRDQTDVELPSNVTATVEGSGRFFSTPNLDSCWTEIGSQDRFADDDNRYDIAGTLFCIAPLGELNGDSSVSILQLTFTSTINWSAN